MSSRIIPRNLIWVVLNSFLPWNSMWSGIFGTLLLADLKIVNEDLSALRVSLLALNQDVNWDMMFFAVEIISSILSLWKNIEVSSANILTLPNGQQAERSLINMRKSRVPKTEPWGTLQEIERVWDLLFQYEHIVCGH